MKKPWFCDHDNPWSVYQVSFDGRGHMWSYDLESHPNPAEGLRYGYEAGNQETWVNDVDCFNTFLGEYQGVETVLEVLNPFRYDGEYIFTTTEAKIVLDFIASSLDARRQILIQLELSR